MLKNQKGKNTCFYSILQQTNRCKNPFLFLETKKAIVWCQCKKRPEASLL